jgi:hypothetical protein
MIYAMASDIQAILNAKEFPISVIYTPERTERDGYARMITIERDRSSGDGVSGAVAVNANARRVMTRSLGVWARIYVRSELDGARINDHEHEADDLVDALIIALFQWCAETRTLAPTFTEARFLDAKERDDVEEWPGVVYSLRFGIARGIYDRKYDGSAKPTASLSGFANSTMVSRTAGDSGELPVQGCGD